MREKQFMKQLLQSLAMFLCVFFLAGTGVCAAVTYPEPIRTITAAPGEKTAVLRWGKAANASGYYVYQVSGKRYKQLKSVKGTSVKITRLKEGQTYRFAVKSYRKSGRKIYKSKQYSPIVKVSIPLKAPARPVNVKAIPAGDSGVGLSWKRDRNADGYEIYRVEDDGRKTKVAEFKGSVNRYTVSGQRAGKQVKFCIRAYRKQKQLKAYSAFSAVVSAVPKALSTEAKAITSIRYTAKTRRTITVYNYTLKKNQVIKAGQSVVVPYKKEKGYMLGWLKNGQKIKIKGSDVRTNGFDYNSKTDYSKAAKEEMINSRNLNSDTPYLIWASQYRCRINVFKGSVGNWKLIKTFRCGIGTYGHPSPKGIRKIYSKTRYGKYGITLQWSNGGPDGSGNTFHEPLGIAVGRPNSHGCFRMKVSDLNWLYNVIPVGTLVYSW